MMGCRFGGGGGGVFTLERAAEGGGGGVGACARDGTSVEVEVQVVRDFLQHTMRATVPTLACDFL